MAAENNYNKYERLKRQVSHNYGQDWQDVYPPEYKPGKLIEAYSRDCGWDGEQYKDVLVPNEVICEGYTSYEKLETLGSMDGGVTWYHFSPRQYKKGNLIKENASDCGYINIIYKDVILYNQYLCDENNDKYEKVEIEYSIDDGKTYQSQNPPQYKYGKKISSDVPTECKDINKYKQVIWNGQWICEDGIKYQKAEILVDYLHNGNYISQTPPVIEKGANLGASSDCVENLYRYILIGTMCENGDLYEQIERQYSPDGTNWYSFNPPDIGKGNLIETGSTECIKYKDNIMADEFVCENNNKYEKIETLKSVDGGKTYQSQKPPVYKVGNLLESNASYCSTASYTDKYIPYDPKYPYTWICEGKNQYDILETLISYSGTPYQSQVPPVYKKGDLIMENSPECN